MRCLEGTDSALGEKQMQTEKEGNLSLAGPIIKAGVEKPMVQACSSCATAVHGR